MNTLDYISLALGGGLSLAAVIYALYVSHSLSSTIAGQAALIIGLGDKLSEALRNGLTYQQQRDTEKGRADEAVAELALVKSQLVSTQAALVAAEKVNTENAAASVTHASDPNAALDSLLSSEARTDVPDATSTGAANGPGGKPAL